MKKIVFDNKPKLEDIGIYLSDLKIILVRKKSSFHWLKWFGVEV